MFYERLKTTCKEKGIALTAMVKDLGMSTGNISKWKNGKVPKSDTVKALAEYLGVTTDYLLENDKAEILEEKCFTLLDDPQLILTNDEKWVILKYRELDKEGRTMVESLLISESRRSKKDENAEVV